MQRLDMACLHKVDRVALAGDNSEVNQLDSRPALGEWTMAAQVELPSTGHMRLDSVAVHCSASQNDQVDIDTAVDRSDEDRMPHKHRCAYRMHVGRTHV